MRNYRSLPSGSVARARELRRSRTEAEKRLWDALRKSWPRHFRFQVPYGGFFVDFLSFRDKLIVEVDGGTHAQATDYDATRTRYLESEGYRVLRFWNHDVMGNIDGVIATIGDSFSQREKEGAAKLRKDEGERTGGETTSPSPSHASHGPLPLPLGEGR